jgi:SAM-dependent methyltransferase
LPELDRLRQQWTKLADRDPYWAVLTQRGKRAGGWDVEAFLESGRVEVRQVVDHVAGLGVTFGGARALDFGCGLGRITQALAPHFEQVVGTDISPRMVEQAQRLNDERNPHRDRCTFVLNDGPGLGQIPDEALDLAYSSRVLQHMRPPLALAFLQSLARKVRSGGALIVQVPTRPSLHPKGLIVRCCPDRLLDRVRKMEMHGIPRGEVEAVIEQYGFEVLDVCRDRAAGPGWISVRYYALRET